MSPAEISEGFEAFNSNMSLKRTCHKWSSSSNFKVHAQALVWLSLFNWHSSRQCRYFKPKTLSSISRDKTCFCRFLRSPTFPALQLSDCIVRNRDSKKRGQSIRKGQQAREQHSGEECPKITELRIQRLHAACNKPVRVGRVEKTFKTLRQKCSGTSTSEEYWRGAMFHKIVFISLNISVYLEKI